jgi:hypothetical protein
MVSLNGLGYASIFVVVVFIDFVPTTFRLSHKHLCAFVCVCVFRVYLKNAGSDDEVCGICQSAFEGVAPGVKYPGDECPVVFGKCG